MAATRLRSLGLRTAAGVTAAALVGLPMVAAHGADLPTAAEPLVVSVVLNATLVSDGQIVYAAEGGGFWIDAQTLKSWRVRIEGTAQLFAGKPHQRVCAPAAALRCSYDELASTLTLQAAQAAIEPQRLVVAAPPALRADEAASTLYANYDLFVARSSGLSAPAASALLDTRAVTTSGEFYVRTGWLAAQGSAQLVNRAAGWVWDWPEQQRSLTIGGFVSEGSLQRGALGVVGARYASNALLQPALSRLPRPWIAAEAARPSRADLFVDGLFRRTAEIAYGRVEFEADGTMAGAGELQAVLTDARGEKTVERLVYYVAPQLLAPGLSEFAVELGRAGSDLALKAPQRGALFLSAQRRQGLSDSWTLGAQTVLARGVSQGGLTSEHLLRLNGRALGVGRGGVAWVDRGDGAKAHWLLGHEYQDRNWSALLRLEWAAGERSAPPGASAAGSSAGVTPLASGLLPTDRRNLIGSLSLALDANWQLGVSWFERMRSDGQRSAVSALSLSWRGPRRLQVNASLQHLAGSRRQTAALLSLVMPLERDDILAVSAGRTGSVSSVQSTINATLTPGNEFDAARQARLFGRQDGDIRQAGFGVNGEEPFGQWSAEALASSLSGGNRASLRLGGAIGVAGEQAFFARRIDDAHILVDSDGQPGLPVYLENRFAGKTNAQGRLVVAGARAWQSNRISLDASALPVEFSLAEDQLDLVPRSRALALARFEISDGGELVPVLRADGTQLPAGATASVSSQRRPAAVNSRGEVFVQRAGRAARVVVQWPGGNCAFDYAADTAMTERLDQGAFLCK